MAPALSTLAVATTAAAANYSLLAANLPQWHAPMPQIRAAGSDVTTPCDKTCMQRVLYKTAYSSAAQGLGLTMRAFANTDGCSDTSFLSSDRTADDCSAIIKGEVDAIASAVMRHITTPTAHSGDAEQQAQLVMSMSQASEEAAGRSLLWGMQYFDGTETADDEKLQKLKWMVHHLAKRGTSELDMDKLKSAMTSTNADSETSTKTASVQQPEDDDSKKLFPLIGLLAVPDLILGPLLGAATHAWSDPHLSDAATASWLRGLLEKIATQRYPEGGIPETSWLHYLLDFERPVSEAYQAEMAEYWDWASEVTNSQPGYLGEDPQLPPPGTSDLTTLRNPTWKPEWRPESIRSFAPSELEDPATLHRLESFDPETSTLRQDLLQYAADLDYTFGRAAQMQSIGYKGFYRLNSDGFPLRKVEWRDPLELTPIDSMIEKPESWRDWTGKGDKGKERMLEDPETGEPQLDSMGDPILGSEGTLLSLQPIAPPEGVAGPSRWYDVMEPDVMEPGSVEPVATLKKVLGFDRSVKVAEFYMEAPADKILRLTTEDELRKGQPYLGSGSPEPAPQLPPFIPAAPAPAPPAVQPPAPDSPRPDPPIGERPFGKYSISWMKTPTLTPAMPAPTTLKTIAKPTLESPPAGDSPSNMLPLPILPIATTSGSSSTTTTPMTPNETTPAPVEVYTIEYSFRPSNYLTPIKGVDYGPHTMLEGPFYK